MTKSAAWMLVLVCATALAACGPTEEEWDTRLAYLKTDAHAHDRRYDTAAARDEAVQRFHGSDLAIQGDDGTEYAFFGDDATVLRVEYVKSFVAYSDFKDPLARLDRMFVETGSWNIYAITPNRRFVRFIWSPENQRTWLGEISVKQAQGLGLDTKLALQRLPQM